MQKTQQTMRVVASLLAALVATCPAKGQDVEVTAGGKGFSIKTTDGANELRLRGIVHADGRFALDDEKKQITDTFLLRRARLAIEGKVHGIYSFRLMPDWAEGRPQLLDFYAEIRPRDALGVRFGKFKSPVGLERLQSAWELTFIERAYPTSLAPNRDVGVNLVGAVRGGVVEYTVGVVNGSGDGASTDLDVSDAKDVVGRVFARPLAGLGVGVAFTTGDQAGAPPSYRSPGQATILGYTSNVVLDDERTRIAPQASYHLGPLGVLGEYVSVKQTLKRDATEAETETKAWQIAASYVVTGEKASYKSVTPANPYDGKSGSAGAVELSARYSTLETDQAAFDAEFADPARSVESATTVTAGANWHLQKHIKLQVNYESTSFEGGAANGEDRPDESVLLTRFQFAY